MSSHPVLGLLKGSFADGWLRSCYPLLQRRSWVTRAEAFDRQRQRIVEIIAENQDIGLILNKIVGNLQVLIPGAGFVILLTRNDRLMADVHAGIPEEILQRLQGTIGDEPGAAPSYVRSPKWLSIATENRCAPLREVAPMYGIRGFLAFPLYSGANELLGVLTVIPKTPKESSRKEKKWLEMASRLAAIAIEQRNVVDELNYRAQHDPLTHLYNRVMMEKTLQEVIQAAGLMKGTVSLLYIDLDRFMLINDLLGRRVGDAVIQQVAIRFTNCVPSRGMLARVGGDEFIMVLPSAQPRPDLKTAEALLDSLNDPFFVGGHELHVSASIGISACPDHAINSTSLERNAFSALVMAKKLGRNQTFVYQHDAERDSPERLEIERHLRLAVRNRELYLMYQPQVDLNSQRLVGGECLLRWRHSILGSVSPGTFVPIAEEAGLIVPIGTWVLEEACRQQLLWRCSGVTAMRLSINVSAAQFDRPDFLDLISKVLLTTGADPQTIVLELTESAVMQNRERSLQYMNALRQLGIEFSLDDFGTGHSSLAQLKKLPIHEIKIDRSFVQEIRSASHRPPVVECIIGLAQRLGLRTVAEGIEDHEQLEALIAMGCETGQGFLFAKPMAPADFQALAEQSAPFEWVGGKSWK